MEVQHYFSRFIGLEGRAFACHKWYGGNVQKTLLNIHLGVYCHVKTLSGRLSSQELRG